MHRSEGHLCDAQHSCALQARWCSRPDDAKVRQYQSACVTMVVQQMDLLKPLYATFSAMCWVLNAVCRAWRLSQWLLGPGVLVSMKCRRTQEPHMLFGRLSEPSCCMPFKVLSLGLC